jgi:site-specific recombinase
LLTIAFAIALGWALYQLAHGVATFVDGLFTHLPAGVQGIPYSSVGGGLTWEVHHHLVALDGIVIGVVQLAVVLGIAAFVQMRSRAAANPPVQDGSAA